jgi:hypothetical protein
MIRPWFNHRLGMMYVWELCSLSLWIFSLSCSLTGPGVLLHTALCVCVCVCDIELFWLTAVPESVHRL